MSMAIFRPGDCDVYEGVWRRTPRARVADRLAAASSQPARAATRTAPSGMCSPLPSLLFSSPTTVRLDGHELLQIDGSAAVIAASLKGTCD